MSRSTPPGDPEKYRTVAQSLRELAAQAGLPPEQAAKADSLAAYFEQLADDPSAKTIAGRTDHERAP